MQSLQNRNCLLYNTAIFCHPLLYIFPKLKKKIHVLSTPSEIYCHPYDAILAKKYTVIPCRNIVQFWQRNMLSSPAEICYNFGKEIRCHPPQNMLQFWQRNVLSSLEICCNFGKEIYCFPLQKYSAILAKKYIVIACRNIVKFWQKNTYCHPLQI